MREFLPDDAATGVLAKRLAVALPKDTGGLTLLLRGELGAGKSTFARALIRALGHEGPVPSPTYTLVEPYEVSAGNVYHIDLYRIASEEELRYLGWTELDEGFRIVEWPDRAPGIVAAADLLLMLEYREPGRQAELEGLTAAGEAIVARVLAVTEPVD